MIQESGRSWLDRIVYPRPIFASFFDGPPGMEFRIPVGMFLLGATMSVGGAVLFNHAGQKAPFSYIGGVLFLGGCGAMVAAYGVFRQLQREVERRCIECVYVLWYCSTAPIWLALGALAARNRGLHLANSGLILMSVLGLNAVAGTLVWGRHTLIRWRGGR